MLINKAVLSLLLWALRPRESDRVMTLFSLGVLPARTPDLQAKGHLFIDSGYMYDSAPTTKLDQHASESSSILGYVSQNRLKNNSTKL